MATLHKGDNDDDDDDDNNNNNNNNNNNTIMSRYRPLISSRYTIFNPSCFVVFGMAVTE